MKPPERWLAWLLTLAVILAALPTVLPAEPTYDELADTTYTSCPPADLLQGKSPSERSQILQQ